MQFTIYKEILIQKNIVVLVTFNSCSLFTFFTFLFELFDVFALLVRDNNNTKI